MRSLQARFGAVALVLASTALLSGRVVADNGCPAFNSSMIDAAWLAVDYSQPGPPEAYYYDVPSIPALYCFVRNDSDHVFKIYIQDEVAEVFGHGEFGISPTLMRTRVDGLSKNELHACRAQVLGSFVWKQYCTQGVEWEPPTD